MIDPDLVASHGERRLAELERDLEHLGEQLARRGLDVEDLVRRAMAFEVAIPSWGVGKGGTRFARFPMPGEPRNVEEKLADCAVVHQLTRITPRVSLHVPWDEPEDPHALRRMAAELGLGFDAMNSNTFQDQPGQEHSYEFGSLTHTDAAVRRQAIEANLHCIELGRVLGSKALTVWIGDGGNFPGQIDFRGAFERYVDGLRSIHAALPQDWRLLLEHKLYEPAFYSTVNNDWGTSYQAAVQTGERAFCLVDLGHHAPTTNIECIVARLAQFGRLGGFHFNDSKYGDDDLDSGAIDPYRLFLVFCELEARPFPPGREPAHMLDQSHNVTDPIESLAISAIEVQRAMVCALLVDREALRAHQEANDALAATLELRRAFRTDVEPILAMARHRAGGAIDPLGVYRASGYRAARARERPLAADTSGGIV